MKRRMARAMKWMGAFVLVLAVLYAAWWAVARIALWRAYAALERDGRPMNVEQIVPAWVPDTNNAALLYEAAALRLKAEPADSKDGRNLLNALLWAGQEVEDRDAKPKAIARCRELLGREAVREALRMVQTGASRGACRYEVDYSAAARVEIQHLQGLRQLTGLLCASARIHAADGDGPAAWENILTALRLTTALETEPLLVSQLVRGQQLFITVRAIETLGASVRPSAAQYAELDAVLRRFDDMNPLARAIDGERLILGESTWRSSCREMRECLGRTRNPRLLTALWLYWPGSGRHWEHAVWLRLTRAAAAHASRLPYESPPGRERAELHGIARRSLLLLELPLGALIRSRDKYVALAVAPARLARTGLAVLRYHDEHGDWPESLAAAGAGGDDLLDPFSGKPLVYRRTPTDAILYSVGENRADEGGRPSNDTGVNDIVWQCTRPPVSAPAATND